MSGAAPTFGPTLLQLDPNMIDDSERLGLFFPDKAEALGHMMQARGHRTPITVRKSGPNARLPWKLVVGKHRLAGARLKELPFVYALERIGGNADEAKDEEASENLDRREQPPLERAIAISSRLQTWSERSQPASRTLTVGLRCSATCSASAMGSISGLARSWASGEELRLPP